MVPASGWLASRIIWSSVVLPTPFGPMTPTMPFGGRLKLSPSISVRSPNPLTRLRASTTRRPSRGSGGIWIRSKSSRCRDAASAAICSYRSSRARLLAWRARGLDRTHSSSCSSRLRSLASRCPSTFILAALVSR